MVAIIFLIFYENSFASVIELWNSWYHVFIVYLYTMKNRLPKGGKGYVLFYRGLFLANSVPTCNFLFV